MNSNKRYQNIELLAPAGSMETFQAVQMQFTSVAADSVHAPMRIILLRKNCFWQLIMRIFMGEKCILR